MKCIKCGEEISDKVYKLHVKRCKGIEPVVTEETESVTEENDPIFSDEDIRAKAKSLGIKSSHNKKIETLRAEIVEYESILGGGIDGN